MNIRDNICSGISIRHRFHLTDIISGDTNPQAKVGHGNLLQSLEVSSVHFTNRRWFINREFKLSLIQIIIVVK